MRIWNVEPKVMCNKHLLGEHVECHMFLGCINKGKKLDGYVKKGLVEIHNLKKRHDELAREMKKRGYKHKSPLNYTTRFKIGKVDIERSLKELRDRCFKCHLEQRKGGNTT